MDGLYYFGMTVGLAFALHVAVRLLWGVRGEKALFRHADRMSTGAAEARVVAALGTGRPAREAGFETRRHRASWGVKALATVIAPLLFYVVNTMLIDARGRDVDAATAQWLGLGALALLLWYLAWVWTYSVEIGRDTALVPTLAFVRRSLPLDGLVAVEDPDPHFLRLRFRDGRRAQVLRYLAGRDELEETLAARVSENEGREGGECRNYPRSRRSAVGSSPF
ncbi:hypothetical protein DLJ49_09170 [Rhodovulum sp. 12E13]|uniref:hypothetical protein n=1 Tax=Rhodovulum sp. 12E13 TaxID=2203891 RepID=UPI000E166C03|nr:hypothetical protein [Rhodovulum sp. 12E13]RDC72784.1 hypothetical protein DLJ49_09170 [Rhodovulum sp. 12E13]